jgi:hypothetical protein
MWVRRGAIGFVTLAVGVLLACQSVNNSGSSSASIPSAEVLYVVNNGNLTTYAIDPSSLEPTVTGSPVDLLPGASSSLLQLVPSPNDHFLYLLWTDNRQQEHLSTYATDSSGIPQVPAVKTVDVWSLSQLNIHPSGKFAYAMQIEDEYGYGPYTSKIFLFHVKKSGALGEDGQILATYGPAVVPTLLYGINAKGSELYLGSSQPTGPVYWERPVNQRNGILAAQVLLYRAPLQASTVFGANLIIDYDNSLNTAPPRYVTVLPNTRNSQKHLIQCGSTMLSACGNASDIQLDPSEQYLFLTDPASQQTQVGYIDLNKHTIRDTGSFLPLTAQTPGFAFSPDGKLVYALLASDLSLHIFGFNRSSGALSEGPASIPIPASAGFVPALR